MAPKKRDSTVGYDDIADEIRRRISAGDLPPGAKIPGEKELIATYQVSRETAYRALQVLRDEGLTESRQGAPTRVRRFQPIRRVASERLSASVWGAGTSMWEIDVRGERPQVTELEVGPIEASPRIAAVLGIGRGASVVRRSRLYALDGKPVLKATSYLPGEIAEGTRIADANPGPGGIYRRLKDLGYEPTVFGEEVRARMPSREEKATLQLDRGTPVLCVVRTARTAEGRVVEVNEMVLDAGSYILDYVIEA